MEAFFARMKTREEELAEYGLNESQFLEVVDMFRELMRFDDHWQQKKRLSQVLRLRLQQLSKQRQIELEKEIQHLKRLE